MILALGEVEWFCYVNTSDPALRFLPPGMEVRGHTTCDQLGFLQYRFILEDTRWSSPGVLYGLYVDIMYALFHSCAFCLSPSFRLFCCAVRIFGAGYHRDFLRRSIIAQKKLLEKHQITSTLSILHCKGGRLKFMLPPSGRLFHTGKCSCVISPLLLRKDHKG